MSGGARGHQSGVPSRLHQPFLQGSLDCEADGGDHRAEDQPLLERIEHGITFGGRVRVFTDRTVVRPGDRWQTELRRALETAHVFIVIGSPASARSAVVLQELGGAWALGKPIVIATPEGEIAWAPPIDPSAYRRVALTELEQPAFAERLLEELTQSPVEGPES